MLQALYITAVGMLIVFACLGLIMLVMLIIGKLFRTKDQESEAK